MRSKFKPYLKRPVRCWGPREEQRAKTRGLPRSSSQDILSPILVWM